MDKIKISGQDNCLKLHGALTFTTVVACWQEAKLFFSQIKQPTLKVDLADVDHCDSAGLALLLAFMRLAHQHHKTLGFSGFPHQMYKLAKVSGLNTILPILRDEPA